MQDLLQKGGEIRVFKPGDMIEGTLISVGKNEVYIDVEGVGIGDFQGYKTLPFRLERRHIDNDAAARIR
jgi:hypothetical protein